MPGPIISLLHPTARVVPSEAFPRGWRDAHDAWLARADHPERIEYILTVHASRWEEANAQEVADYRAEHPDDYLPGASASSAQAARGWYGFSRVRNDKRDCVVDQTNLAAEVSRGKILMGVADDYFPPEHWDTLMLDAIPKVQVPSARLHWAPAWAPDFSTPFQVVCSTGAGPERDRELMIGGCVSRALYERRGYVLDPDFESMFSDNWWAFENRRDEAAGLVKIIERLDIQFEHRHPVLGKNQMDDVYRQQNREAAYRQGFATFQKKAYGTEVLAVCCPGETFRAEWVWATFDLMLQLETGSRFIVARHGGYTSNVYATRYEMTDQVNKMAPLADYVLWLDDDNMLTAAQFEMLYQDLQEHQELAGVVGWCWCDHEGPGGDDKPWMMSVGRQGSDMSCLRMTQNDLRKAMESRTFLVTSADIEPHAFWSGFPVVLLRASVLRFLGPGAFAPLVRSDVEHGFTSEDTAFFWRARQAGLQFAVDLRVKVPHVKLRQIEPYTSLTEVNRDEYLAAKGLKLVPVEASAAD